jgi:predicted transcriptional regulator
VNPVSDDVATVLKHFPKGSTIEDVKYGLYVLQKIEHSLADVDAGRTLTHTEVEQRLAKWLTA